MPAPDDVAVDWINDKLYWVDALWARIEVMDISDGSNQERAEVIKLTNHTIPRGIAVDPTSRSVVNLLVFTCLEVLFAYPYIYTYMDKMYGGHTYSSFMYLFTNCK